jgi:hypothetical protein
VSDGIRTRNRLGHNWKTAVLGGPHTLRCRVAGGIAATSDFDAIRDIFDASPAHAQHLERFWNVFLIPT